MGRAPCCDKAKVKRGPWSPEEDIALKSYVERHGTGGNWIALPHKAGAFPMFLIHFMTFISILSGFNIPRANEMKGLPLFPLEFTETHFSFSLFCSFDTVLRKPISYFQFFAPEELDRSIFSPFKN